MSARDSAAWAIAVVSSAPSRCAVLSPSPPLERLQMTIAPSSMRRRKVMVLFGCASMLRRRGSISALPILFWIGAMASVRKPVAVAGILVEPERPHHGIADMVLDELHAERLVDEQAGEHQQAWRRARRAARARHW